MGNRHDTETSREQGKVSGREALRLYLRILRLVWKHYPGSLFGEGLYYMVQALSPYVPLYFSARFLDELAGQRRQEELIKWVILLLALSAVTTLATHFLGSWEKLGRISVYWEHQSDFYSKKLLETDFEKASDPAVLDRLSQIEQHQQFMGYGMNQFMIHLEQLWRSFFQIAGGVLLSCSLFTLPLGEKYQGNETLQAVLWCILLLILVSVFLPALFGRVEGRDATAYVRAGAKSNKLFEFYGMDLFSDRRNALDVRTYRQDLFGDKVLREDNQRAVNDVRSFIAKRNISLCRMGEEASAYVMMGFIYLYVCLKAWFGAFGVGSVTRYVGAVNSVAKGMSILAKTLAQARTNAPFLGDILDFMDIPNEMYQGSLTVEKRRDRNYEVEFRDVSFRYPNASEYALRHVNLKFRVGERLAVVGENGSGKTTFIKLLCRLYDPTEGQILLNGIDIRKYDYREYLSIFSVVFQDFRLLSLSLGQNVAASVSYDAARVRECLEKAGMGEWLRNHPEGLATQLYKDLATGEGVDISGGEEQKIALARSMYRNAPFIILDEPTAALDPLSEYEVYTHFNDIVADCTAIYISHRLSSCRFCDEIAVFHRGSVIEQGSHEALLGKGGKYSQLWHAQAQYYK